MTGNTSSKNSGQTGSDPAAIPAPGGTAGTALDSEAGRALSDSRSRPHRRNPLGWLFSLDHKVIGLQFLWSSLLWLAVGGLLALAIRWQLAWPWTEMPVLGRWLFAGQGGQITPEFYNVLFTMHATVMVFFVIIPVLSGAFGNYLIPLMIGCRDMAFPLLNLLSFWLMWPAFGLLVASVMVPGQGPSSGWTAYPPLSEVFSDSQSLWTLSLVLVGIASMMGAINYITTILQMRAPGMTLMRMPMTVWGLLITAVLQAFALPVLTVALFMQLGDRWLGMDFFVPQYVLDGADTMVASGGGDPLLWQHLFWFYSHPAVYIMILPAMGMVSDMLSCFSRKPLFGYRPMVFSMCAIAGMGFLVWGHHMFVSGMNYLLSVSFAVSTMLIALPSGIKVFNWLATVWGGRLQMTTAMLFSLGFVSMFVIGGLSGVVMASPAADIVVHDTYYIVAHFHYVLFGSSLLAVFGAFHFWFPRMFGRMLNEGLGKLHFLLTFLCLNGTFFPMHFLGLRGFPRRYADPYVVESFRDLLPLNQFITWAAFGLAAAQLVFLLNLLLSLGWGRRATPNPWQANSLEWTAPMPVPHGNFTTLPVVHRGPYGYSQPGRDADFWPQDQLP